MRLSQLGNKEIVNLENGERLGMLGQCDFLIDEHTGHVQTFVLHRSNTIWKGLWGSKRADDVIHIPWTAIRTVGAEMIIIELRAMER